MSDFLISLLIAAVFAGVWSALYQLGGLDWLLDARMASARRMLTAAKFAFDGEVHAVGAAPLSHTSQRHTQQTGTPAASRRVKASHARGGVFAHA
jgi:hypothetical protein